MEKIAFFLQLEKMTEEEIKDLLLYIKAAKHTFRSDICPADLRFKSGKALVWIPSEGAGLRTYEEISEIAKEGYKLISASDKHDFFSEIVSGKYKYYHDESPVH